MYSLYQRANGLTGLLSSCLIGLLSAIALSSFLFSPQTTGVLDIKPLKVCVSNYNPSRRGFCNIWFLIQTINWGLSLVAGARSIDFLLRNGPLCDLMSNLVCLNFSSVTSVIRVILILLFRFGHEKISALCFTGTQSSFSSMLQPSTRTQKGLEQCFSRAAHASVVTTTLLLTFIGAFIGEERCSIVGSNCTTEGGRTNQYRRR